MRTNKPFWTKIQNLWKQKPTVVSLTEKKDEYAVKQDKRTDLIIRIFSVLVAVLIWVYAVSTGDSVHTTNLDYTTSHLEIRNESVLEETGLLYSIDETVISVAVQGRRMQISTLKPEDITIYLDFSNVRSVGKQAVKINADLPQGFTLTSVSPEYVWVNVTES